MTPHPLSNLRLLVVGRALHYLHSVSSQISPASDLRSALAHIRTQAFDCIIVDRELDDGDGIVLAPTIKRIQPDAISLLLTPKILWASVEAARELGYSMVLDRSTSVDEIIHLIRIRITEGGREKKRGLPAASKMHLLSLTEREILLNLSTGATTQEIAIQRHNSVATIKSHLASIYRKLEVRNRVEAIAELRRS